MEEVFQALNDIDARIFRKNVVILSHSTPHSTYALPRQLPRT